MPDNSLASIVLPDRQQVEVVFVRLANGKIVPRGAGELLPVPAGGPVAPGARPPASTTR